MKYVVFYDLADGAEALAQEHFAAHRAWSTTFQEQGSLLMIGTFTDAPLGAIAVFRTRESAEDFVAGDPFVRHGVVAEPRLREWNEILAP